MLVLLLLNDVGLAPDVGINEGCLCCWFTLSPNCVIGPTRIELFLYCLIESLQGHALVTHYYALSIMQCTMSALIDHTQIDYTKGSSVQQPVTLI